MNVSLNNKKKRLKLDGKGKDKNYTFENKM